MYRNEMVHPNAMKWCEDVIGKKVHFQNLQSSEMLSLVEVIAQQFEQINKITQMASDKLNL